MSKCEWVQFVQGNYWALFKFQDLKEDTLYLTRKEWDLKISNKRAWLFQNGQTVTMSGEWKYPPSNCTPHSNNIFEQTNGLTYKALMDCHWIQYSVDKTFLDYFNFVQAIEDPDEGTVLQLINDVYDISLYEDKIIWNSLDDKTDLNLERGKWKYNRIGFYFQILV